MPIKVGIIQHIRWSQIPTLDFKSSFNACASVPAKHWHPMKVPLRFHHHRFHIFISSIKRWKQNKLLLPSDMPAMIWSRFAVSYFIHSFETLQSKIIVYNPEFISWFWAFFDVLFQGNQYILLIVKVLAVWWSTTKQLSFFQGYLCPEVAPDQDKFDKTRRSHYYWLWRFSSEMGSIACSRLNKYGIDRSAGGRIFCCRNVLLQHIHFPDRQSVFQSWYHCQYWVSEAVFL